MPPLPGFQDLDEDGEEGSLERIVKCIETFACMLPCHRNDPERGFPLGSRQCPCHLFKAPGDSSTPIARSQNSVPSVPLQGGLVPREPWRVPHRSATALPLQRRKHRWREGEEPVCPIRKEGEGGVRGRGGQHDSGVLPGTLQCLRRLRDGLLSGSLVQPGVGARRR